MTTAAALAKRVKTATSGRRFGGGWQHMTTLGSLTLRFSGASLAHIGKSLDRAIEQALLLTKAQLTACGVLKPPRFTEPKLLASGGRAMITAALDATKTLPAKALQLYIKDGDPSKLPPTSFGIYASLAHGSGKTTAKGFLSIAFPIVELADDRWVELGDQLVATLGAEVAWLGPSVWLAPSCLLGSSTLCYVERLIRLFRVDPQLDVPSYFAGPEPFACDEIDPDPLSGFLAPSWVMWASAKLAKSVTSYRGKRVVAKGATRFHASTTVPFAMTEEMYAEWRAAWADLAPLQIRYTGFSDEAPIYLTRFSATSYAGVGPGFDETIAKKARLDKIILDLRKLADKPGPKLLKYADSVMADLDESGLWIVVDALTTMILQGTAKPDGATVWLDLCETMAEPGVLFEPMARLASVTGELDRSIDLLTRAFDAGWLRSAAFSRDRAFKALRTHRGWDKLVKRGNAKKKKRS